MAIKNLTSLLASKLNQVFDQEKLARLLAQFRVYIPSSLQQRMEHKQSQGLNAQFVPQAAELQVQPSEGQDPIGDRVHSKLRGLVHRHADRCLLLPLFTCPVYCRFCFRKAVIGKEKNLSQQELRACYNYIRHHPEIWEVILTGGDPLMLGAETLATILQELAAIEHVALLRIHTRVPFLAPEKLDTASLQALSLAKPVYMVLHVNHPDEISAAGIAAIQALLARQVILLSQTVLLKGVNDDVNVLKALFKQLTLLRVKPYYLHHLDAAEGVGHFRVPLAEGQVLAQQLRAQLSGLCQPTYVLDIPGGYGKVPLADYVRCERGEYQVRDLAGHWHCFHE
jgi:lysine 2,3-aminomutase